MTEAWNDDITNMFADLLDWLQEAYEEREKEADRRRKITPKHAEASTRKADKVCDTHPSFYVSYRLS